MKKRKAGFQKLIQFVCITLLAVGLQSCETEIPPEDPTPPKFSFQLIGDGFNHTFNQDTDFDNIRLMLHRYTTYDFIFSGSDDGGVERVQLAIEHSGGLIMDFRIPAPWTQFSNTPYQIIQWNGNRNNPLDGAAIGGNFRLTDYRDIITFKFTVSDFGGNARRPNTISKELSVSLGNVHRTRIKNL